MSIIYILCFTFVIPALINLGAAVISAHLFAFYYALSAPITPPVAFAAFAAAIAGSGPMRTGFQACRLGIAVFMLPFIFVYRPELLGFRGGVGGYGFFTVLVATVMTTIIVFCVAAGLEGWLVAKSSLPERILTLAGSGGMYFSLLQTKTNFTLFLAGLGVVGLVVLLQVVRARRAGKVGLPGLKRP